MVRERLMALADVIPAIVWVSDPSGAVFHASESFYEFIGRRDLDLASGEWLTTLHPDDVAAATEAWLGALRNESDYSCEFRVRRHDGVFRWHVLTGRPVLDEAGQVAAWYGSALDIDDARREREMMAAEANLLSSVATNASLDEVLAEAQRLLETLIGGEWSVQLTFDTEPRSIGAATAFAADAHGNITAELHRSGGDDVLDAQHRIVLERAAHLVSIAIERSRADSEVREAEAAARLAARLAHTGAWSAVLGERYLTWSDEVCDIHGVPHGTRPTPRESVAGYSPEDQLRIGEAIERCTTHGVPFDLEAQLTRPDGTVLWVRAVAEAEHDRKGNVVAVRGALQDISNFKAAEAAQRAIERRFSDVARATSDVVWEFDAETNTIWRSEGLTDVFGEGGAVLTEPIWGHRVHPDDVDRVRRGYFEALTARAPEWRGECRMARQAGGWCEVRIGAFLVWDGERLVRMVGNVVDVTDQREMERQRLQGQRLEAIGQLTGGVAHDFNNLLTVILGGAELLEESAQPADREIATMIRRAAERGADLTHRLLAFARRQPLEPAPLDVHELLAGLDVMLRRTLGEDLRVEYVRAAGLWTAMADGPQLESAVLNLCLNARDAMPEGGSLTIETVNSSLDRDYAAQHPGVEPGQYVMIAVSDTGMGMSPEVLSQVFEPFFTTKSKGAGTGLGLSMVYGFAKQSRGHVKVYSEVGHGTTVRLYLPRSYANPSAASNAVAGSAVGGDERILVVEDDVLVREHVVRQLSQLGYRIRSAASADDALVMLEADNEIDLLFTDVVMPGKMNGRQLADLVAERWPEIKVLFTSGYTENAIVHHGRLDHGVHLLVKPYRLQDLADRVRSVLDGGR